MVFSPAVFMEIERYTHELDKAARQQIEGANDNVPVTTPQQLLVIIESPYAGDVEANTAYARSCLLDCLQRGEAPIVSHLLHTQVLDDRNKFERKWGIEAGLAWYRVADKCVVYTDRGMSGGMSTGVDRAKQYGVPVEYRSLNEGQVAA